MATEDCSDHGITKELLDRALRHAEQDDHVTVNSFEVKPGSSHGDNYACVVYAVDVEAVLSGKDKVYNLMIKCLPQSQMRRQWVRKSSIFEKEAKAYTELIPEMLLFQRNIGRETLVPSTPKCYYAITDGENDVLILENLTFKGYNMVDRMKGTGYEHCKLVMGELAKFHAISLAMKQHYTESLPKKYPFLKEAFFNDTWEELTPLMEKSYTDLIQFVGNNPDYCEYAKRMEKFSGRWLETVKEALEPKEPFSLICHGDCWSNNMLFIHETKGDHTVPVSIQLVDLQMVRYSNPATDLVYFFYTSTTPSLRKDHLEDLLKLYHVTFLDCVKHLGADSDIYTFDKLKSNFHDCLPFGYLMACMILPPILTDPKYIPDLDTIVKENMEEFGEEWKNIIKDGIKNNVHVKERICGMVEEMALMEVI